MGDGCALCLSMRIWVTSTHALDTHTNTHSLSLTYNAQVCFGMGVCYFKLKNTVKARECFARVLELVCVCVCVLSRHCEVDSIVECVV